MVTAGASSAGTAEPVRVTWWTTPELTRSDFWITFISPDPAPPPVGLAVNATTTLSLSAAIIGWSYRITVDRAVSGTGVQFTPSAE